MFENKLPNYELLRKEYTLIDMHVHSNASHDCGTSIQSIGSKLKMLGIGVSITDHNTILGSLSLKGQFRDLLIIPGIEVTTKENKDVLLYFEKFSELKDYSEKVIEKGLKNKRTNTFKMRTNISLAELFDSAADYNALRVMPHPLQKPKGLFNYVKRNKELLKKIDAIEALNAGSRKKNNEKIMSWTEELKFPITGGSDSHIIQNLGNVITLSREETVSDILESIRKREVELKGKCNGLRDDLRSFSGIVKNKMSFKK